VATEVRGSIRLSICFRREDHFLSLVRGLQDVAASFHFQRIDESELKDVNIHSGEAASSDNTFCFKDRPRFLGSRPAANNIKTLLRNPFLSPISSNHLGLALPISTLTS
jgi:hypothetical protein